MRGRKMTVVEKVQREMAFNDMLKKRKVDNNDLKFGRERLFFAFDSMLD